MGWQTDDWTQKAELNNEAEAKQEMEQRQLLVSVPFKNPTWLYLGNFPLQIETNENIFYKYRFRQLNMYSHSTNVISELGCRAVYITLWRTLGFSTHTKLQCEYIFIHNPATSAVYHL